mgnify:CR=1 FL=1
MAEGLEVGEITAKLDKDGNVVNVVEKTNSVQSAVLDLAGAAPVSMVRILTNDVRKRLGDIRSAQGTHGAWVRYDGGKLTGDSNYENKFHTVQIGIDTIPEAEAPRFGVAMSYTKGDSEFARGESDMDAFSLATYSTWMLICGRYWSYGHCEERHDCRSIQGGLFEYGIRSFRRNGLALQPCRNALH